MRAATAERTELARHRERLLAARASLRDELARIESSLGEIDERDDLLSRIAPGAGLGDIENDRHDGPPESTSPPPRGRLLRGPAIRLEAVRVLLDQPERPEAMHYRRWYELLTEAGFTVAGKDPLAVFLTQLGRSPLVARGTQTGIYAIDRQAPCRLRQRLSDLHAQLRALASMPEATADLAAISQRRAEITDETAKTERALEEAEELLGASPELQHAAG